MVEEKDKPKGKKRRRGNTLENWEVAIVKAMISRGGPSRTTRTFSPISHARHAQLIIG